MGLRAVAQGHAFTDFSEAHVWGIAGFGSGDCETGSAMTEVVGSNEASNTALCRLLRGLTIPRIRRTLSTPFPRRRYCQTTVWPMRQEYLTVGYHDMGDRPSRKDLRWLSACGCIATRAGETDGHIQLPPAGPELRGWHVIALTGYDDATQLVTFVNSWGSGLRSSGYGAMDYAFIKTYSSGGVAISQLAFAGVDGSCNGVFCPACTKCATGQCVADAAQNGGSCGSGRSARMGSA